VKQARVLNPSLIRCYSVRPIFLGCCVLAVKMTREHTLSLIFLHSLLEDVFNLLDVELLILIERQLLEVLSSQPAHNPQPCSRAYCTFASLLTHSLPPHNAMQVLEWRLPVGAVYQACADQIFHAAANALLAPPMQAPQVLSAWLPPVGTATG
jgi:hypothetical protein